MKCVYEGFMTVEKITAVPTENNLILLLFMLQSYVEARWGLRKQ